jgi:hypothetical protein
MFESNCNKEPEKCWLPDLGEAYTKVSIVFLIIFF